MTNIILFILFLLFYSILDILIFFTSIWIAHKTQQLYLKWKQRHHVKQPYPQHTIIEGELA